MKKILRGRLTLIGFMGAGKTTLGNALAGQFAVQFLDMDHKLEERFGMSISRIFSSHGESEFRKAETALLKEMLNDPTDRVIATGGGIILDPENRKALADSTSCVFLNPPFDLLFQRIQADRQLRPLAANSTREELRKKWENRLPLYKETAHFSTEKFDSTEGIIFEIIDWLKERINAKN